MEKITYNLDFLTKGGPYSHLVEAGGFIFISGLLPFDSNTGIFIKDDIAKATELVLTNMQRALESVGSNLQKVIKVTVFLSDPNGFNPMNNIYRLYFPDNPPARSCVIVKQIPGDMPVEIEAIAIR